MSRTETVFMTIATVLILGTCAGLIWYAYDLATDDDGTPRAKLPDRCPKCLRTWIPREMGDGFVFMNDVRYEPDSDVVVEKCRHCGRSFCFQPEAYAELI